MLLLLALVHVVSLVEKPVPANATERELQDLMSNYKFNLMGSMRSMDNLLRGFSISFILAMIVMGALALLLRRERVGLLKREAQIDTMWLAALNVVSLHYFFAAPTSFLVAALLLFALAWLTLPAESRTAVDGCERPEATFEVRRHRRSR